MPDLNARLRFTRAEALAFNWLAHFTQTPLGDSARTLYITIDGQGVLVTLGLDGNWDIETANRFYFGRSIHRLIKNMTGAS